MYECISLICIIRPDDVFRLNFTYVGVALLLCEADEGGDPPSTVS